MYSSPREQHPSKFFVTKKRMERRTPDGRLLSVTNTRTVHYDEEQPEPRFFRQTAHVPKPKPVPTNHHIACSGQDSYETLRRSSVEYVEPDHIYGDSTIYGDDWSRDGSTSRLATMQTTRERVRNIPIFLRNTSSQSGLDEIVGRINLIRRSAGRPELIPDPRLAEQAGQWAQYLARSNLFRREVGLKMNIWRGRRLVASIADSWFDEAEEFDTINYMKMDWLRTIGAGVAYQEDTGEYYVVVVYD